MKVIKFFLLYGHDQSSVHYKRLAFVQLDANVKGPSVTHRTVVGPFDTYLDAMAYHHKMNTANYIGYTTSEIDLGEDPVECGAV